MKKTEEVIKLVILCACNCIYMYMRKIELLDRLSDLKFMRLIKYNYVLKI